MIPGYRVAIESGTSRFYGFSHTLNANQPVFDSLSDSLRAATASAAGQPYGDTERAYARDRSGSPGRRDGKRRLPGRRDCPDGTAIKGTTLPAASGSFSGQSRSRTASRARRGRGSAALCVRKRLRKRSPLRKPRRCPVHYLAPCARQRWMTETCCNAIPTREMAPRGVVGLSHRGCTTLKHYKEIVGGDLQSPTESLR